MASSCPVVRIRSINEHDSGTLYYIPSDTDDLTWASAAEFTAHQKTAAKELQEAAQQEVQEAAEQHEQEFAQIPGCDCHRNVVVGGYGSDYTKDQQVDAQQEHSGACSPVGDVELVELPTDEGDVPQHDDEYGDEQQRGSQNVGGRGDQQ